LPIYPPEGICHLIHNVSRVTAPSILFILNKTHFTPCPATSKGEKPLRLIFALRSHALSGRGHAGGTLTCKLSEQKSWSSVHPENPGSDIHASGTRTRAGTGACPYDQNYYGEKTQSGKGYVTTCPDLFLPMPAELSGLGKRQGKFCQRYMDNQHFPYAFKVRYLRHIQKVPYGLIKINFSGLKSV